MKGKRAGSLLIFAEVLILIFVTALCVVNYLSKPHQKEEQKIEQNIEDEPVLEETTEAIEATEVTEPESQYEITFSEQVQVSLDEMTPEQKTAQLFLTSPESLTGNERVTIAREGTRTALTDYPIAGLVYRKSNYQGRQQFGALLSGAQKGNIEINSRYLLLAAAGDDEQGEEELVISEVYDTAPLTDLFAAGNMTGTEERIAYPVYVPQNMDTVNEETSYIVYTDILNLTDESQIWKLRSQTGFTGVVLTEDLSSEQVTAEYPDGDAAVKALNAGADLIYQSADFQNAYEKVLDAVNSGEVPMERLNEAVGHILTMKESMPAPTDGDIISNEQ